MASGDAAAAAATPPHTARRWPRICVTCPSRPQVEGTYEVLYAGQRTVNGKPVWATGTKRLYSFGVGEGETGDGVWALAVGMDAPFRGRRLVMANSQHGAGACLPHEASEWLIWNTDREVWTRDASVSVCEATDIFTPTASSELEKERDAAEAAATPSSPMRQVQASPGSAPRADKPLGSPSTGHSHGPAQHTTAHATNGMALAPDEGLGMIATNSVAAGSSGSRGSPAYAAGAGALNFQRTASAAKRAERRAGVGRSAAKALPPPRVRLELLGMQTDANLRVTEIRELGPARFAGIREGDTLITVWHPKLKTRVRLAMIEDLLRVASENMTLDVGVLRPSGERVERQILVPWQAPQGRATGARGRRWIELTSTNPNAGTLDSGDLASPLSRGASALGGSVSALDLSKRESTLSQSVLGMSYSSLRSESSLLAPVGPTPDSADPNKRPKARSWVEASLAIPTGSNAIDKALRRKLFRALDKHDRRALSLIDMLDEEAALLEALGMRPEDGIDVPQSTTIAAFNIAAAGQDADGAETTVGGMSVSEATSPRRGSSRTSLAGGDGPVALVGGSGSGMLANERAAAPPPPLPVIEVSCPTATEEQARERRQQEQDQPIQPWGGARKKRALSTTSAAAQPHVEGESADDDGDLAAIAAELERVGEGDDDDDDDAMATRRRESNVSAGGESLASSRSPGPTIGLARFRVFLEVFRRQLILYSYFGTNLGARVGPAEFERVVSILISWQGTVFDPLEAMRQASDTGGDAISLGELVAWSVQQGLDMFYSEPAVRAAVNATARAARGRSRSKSPKSTIRAVSAGASSPHACGTPGGRSVGVGVSPKRQVSRSPNVAGSPRPSLSRSPLAPARRTQSYDGRAGSGGNGLRGVKAGHAVSKSPKESLRRSLSARGAGTGATGLMAQGGAGVRAGGVGSGTPRGSASPRGGAAGFKRSHSYAPGGGAAVTAGGGWGVARGGTSGRGGAGGGPRSVTPTGARAGRTHTHTHSPLGPAPGEPRKKAAGGKKRTHSAGGGGVGCAALDDETGLFGRDTSGTASWERYVEMLPTGNTAVARSMRRSLYNKVQAASRAADLGRLAAPELIHGLLDVLGVGDVPRGGGGGGGGPGHNTLVATAVASVHRIVCAACNAPADGSVDRALFRYVTEALRMHFQLHLVLGASGASVGISEFQVVQPLLTSWGLMFPPDPLVTLRRASGGVDRMPLATFCSWVITEAVLALLGSSDSPPRAPPVYTTYSPSGRIATV